ncbi:Hypothetical predicted protein [Prunus dulcis]|uniref:Uncharacterized protein n=1 Tax=Prunus dulcis TaxID=3755 RepID=A0A5E4F857_PRUDU|nr:hypothetical protein L3X38_003361 [Prunus dulcis]VVA24086.1 Hypothetical predicted protein [Prunus dulcis]
MEKNKVDYFTCKVIGGTLPWKKSDFLVHLFNLSLYTVSSIYQTGEPALAKMEEEGGGGGGRRKEMVWSLMAAAGTAGSEQQLALLVAVARKEVVEVLGRLGAPISIIPYTMRHALKRTGSLNGQYTRTGNGDVLEQVFKRKTNRRLQRPSSSSRGNLRTGPFRTAVWNVVKANISVFSPLFLQHIRPVRDFGSISPISWNIADILSTAAAEEAGSRILAIKLANHVTLLRTR